MYKHEFDMNETELGGTRQRSQALEPREHFRSLGIRRFTRS